MTEASVTSIPRQCQNKHFWGTTAHMNKFSSLSLVTGRCEHLSQWTISVICHTLWTIGRNSTVAIEFLGAEENIVYFSYHKNELLIIISLETTTRLDHFSDLYVWYVLTFTILLLRIQRYRLSTDDNLNSLREVRVRSQEFAFWRLEESLNNKN